jgi:hypothetical protein
MVWSLSVEEMRWLSQGIDWQRMNAKMLAGAQV